MRSHTLSHKRQGSVAAGPLDAFPFTPVLCSRTGLDPRSMGPTGQPVENVPFVPSVELYTLLYPSSQSQTPTGHARLNQIT